MTFRSNIAAGYVAQIYISIIGVAILPVYIKYLGIEAYGLVGFFAMMQAWFNVLDLGLTPTVTKETTRFKGGVITALIFRRILRALQIVFILIAIAGASSIILSAQYIAQQWLKVDKLPIAHVYESLQLIALGVAMRWVAGLYRACLAGAELLVWLATTNSLIATLRFVFVLPIIIWVDNSIVTFFLYQLAVSIVELFILLIKVKSWVPRLGKSEIIGWKLQNLFSPLRQTISFSLTIAFTATVGIVVANLDKLILSKLIPLENYGYYSLAVIVASSLLIVSGPINSALLPRLANLNSIGHHEELLKLYGQATQLVAVVVLPVAMIMIFLGEELLLVWTGDELIAKHAWQILAMYAVGNTFMAFSALPYYLQFAKGDLRMHLFGNALFVVFMVPLIIWMAGLYGAIGAGFVWMLSNILYFILWIGLVHERFSKSLHLSWLKINIIPIFIPVLIVALIINSYIIEFSGKLIEVFYIIFAGLILMIVAALSSSYVRESALNFKNKLKTDAQI